MPTISESIFKLYKNYLHHNISFPGNNELENTSDILNDWVTVLELKVKGQINNSPEVEKPEQSEQSEQSEQAEQSEQIEESKGGAKKTRKTRKFKKSK